MGDDMMTCNELQTLDMLRVGESARVLSLPQNADLQLRLGSLGLVSGTLITAVNVSPAGDPTAYFFRGALIALRRRDAKGIVIKRETGCGIEKDKTVS